jgi:hypothetical protein
LAACARGPGEDTPEGALELFLAAMDRSAWDESALADAHRLLAEESRAALEERASLANALSGRRFEAWQMLPQGRTRQRFRIRWGRTRTRIDGERAIVTVRGSGETQSADVELAREGDVWRVVLEIPGLNATTENAR